METLNYLQLERLMVPLVWAVLVLVVPTMAAVAADVLLAPGAHALPAPMLATTVAVPAMSAGLMWRPLGEIYWNNTWSYGRTLT